MFKCFGRIQSSRIWQSPWVSLARICILALIVGPPSWALQPQPFWSLPQPPIAGGIFGPTNNQSLSMFYRTNNKINVNPFFSPNGAQIQIEPGTWFRVRSVGSINLIDDLALEKKRQAAQMTLLYNSRAKINSAQTSQVKAALNLQNQLADEANEEYEDIKREIEIAKARKGKVIAEFIQEDDKFDANDLAEPKVREALVDIADLTNSKMVTLEATAIDEEPKDELQFSPLPVPAALGEPVHRGDSTASAVCTDCMRGQTSSADRNFRSLEELAKEQTGPINVRVQASIDYALSHTMPRSNGTWCWCFVKRALQAAGLVNSYPAGGAAIDALEELPKHDFKNIYIQGRSDSEQIRSAPAGAVLIYSGGEAKPGCHGPCGHVEIKTNVGTQAVSDFLRINPLSNRKLEGIMVKEKPLTTPPTQPPPTFNPCR